MSRRCELTGVGPMIGHNVSHSNIKTKRRFLPALAPASLQSDALGQTFKLRISNAAAGAGPIKTVIAYVLTIFVLFLFATSGLINNANIQTQLKNGAYYAGLFSGLVAILIAIDFLGL